MASSSVRITISTAHSDDVFFFELDKGEVLATLQMLLESDSGIAADQQVLVYNNQRLSDGKVGDLFGSENDVSLVLVRQQDLQQRQGGGQRGGQRGGQPDPAAFIQAVQQDPELRGRLSMQNPPLFDAVMANDVEKVRAHLQQNDEARRRQQEHEHLLATADPFDPVAQAKIAEFIRQKNVEENYENAVEHNPESFAQVSMLYVDVAVNGVPLKAFVDSGAQSTIMSEKCAQLCNIYHLIDTRFSGIAQGVGQAKILGRVHMAQLTIGGSHFTSSFTIMEGQAAGKDDLDFLLGLDNLKRHQAQIDLRENVLRIGSEVTPFLAERDIPGFARKLRSSVDGLQTSGGGPASSAPRPATQAPGPGAPPSAAAAAAAAAAQGRAAAAAGAPQPAAPAPAPNSSGVSEESVQMLMSVTGVGREQAVDALRRNNGNADMAAQELMGFGM